MTTWPELLPADLPYYLQAAQELQHRRIARKNFYEFVRQGWAEVEAAPFVDNWHVGAICEHPQLGPMPGLDQPGLVSVTLPAPVQPIGRPKPKDLLRDRPGRLPAGDFSRGSCRRRTPGPHRLRRPPQRRASGKCG